MLKLPVAWLFSYLPVVAMAQGKVEQWEYACSYGPSYYLERTWLADSVFADKHYHTPADIWRADTFYIRRGSAYFKRGGHFYPYLSASAHDRGDTLKYFEKEPVNPDRTWFIVQDFYLPDRKRKDPAGLLTYQVMERADYPKYASATLLFDPKRFLTVQLSSVLGTVTLREKLEE